MSTKSIVMLGAGIGSVIGGYIPVLWGGSPFSGWAILLSAAGGFAGIWLGWKLSNSL